MHEAGSGVTATVASLRASTAWSLVSSTPLRFPAFHPQGLVRHGGLWWLSTVDVAAPQGHLLAFDDAGEQHADLLIGDGPRFHPGGFDVTDGIAYIPVAEYVPRSSASVWRVDLDDPAPAVVFRVDDHLGVVCFRPDRDEHVAMTWGSREIVRLSADGTELDRRANPSHFIDIQDNQLLGPDTLLCSGVSFPPSGASVVGIGGVGLLDLDTLAWVHEIPIVERTAHKRPITCNPVWVELAADGSLLMNVVPDDDEAACLLTYRAAQDGAPQLSAGRAGRAGGTRRRG